MNYQDPEVKDATVAEEEVNGNVAETAEAEGAGEASEEAGQE